VKIPDDAKLAKKSMIELKNLSIKEVFWAGNVTFGFVLSDFQGCKAGNYHFDQSYSFNPKEKITRVEVIISWDELFIIKMNFYSGEKLLAQVG
jgi:hypothetical protein